MLTNSQRAVTCLLDFFSSVNNNIHEWPKRKSSISNSFEKSTDWFDCTTQTVRNQREGTEKSYFFQWHSQWTTVCSNEIRRNITANYMLNDTVSLTRLQCKSLLWCVFYFIRFYWKFILDVIFYTHALSHIRSNYSEDSTIKI